MCIYSLYMGFVEVGVCCVYIVYQREMHVCRTARCRPMSRQM